MNDIGIRINALGAEYQAHVGNLSARAAALAADAASYAAQLKDAQEKLEAALARVAELEKPAKTP